MQQPMHHGHRMAIPPSESKIMGSSFHRNELITILSLRNWRFAGETLHMGKKGLHKKNPHTLLGSMTLRKPFSLLPCLILRSVWYLLALRFNQLEVQLDFLAASQWNGVCSCKSHHRLFARFGTCPSIWISGLLLWLRGWDYYPKTNIGWKSHSSLGQQTHFQILSSFLGVISPDLHPHLFVWHICKGLDTVLQSHFHLKDLSPSQTRLDARQWKFVNMYQHSWSRSHLYIKMSGPSETPLSLLYNLPKRLNIQTEAFCSICLGGLRPVTLKKMQHPTLNLAFPSRSCVSIWYINIYVYICIYCVILWLWLWLKIVVNLPIGNMIIHVSLRASKMAPKLWAMIIYHNHGVYIYTYVMCICICSENVGTWMNP